LGLYCAATQLGKNPNVYYCGYDQKMCDVLNEELGAVHFMNTCKDNFDVKTIITKIVENINTHEKWRNKITYDY
jgi:hypothetical protein